MATNFPSSVDSFTNPTTSDTLASVPHASQHADVNDAVEAIETALLDGAPLHIDDANERVGIGTTSPLENLHVNGSSLITGYVEIGSNLTVDSGVLHVNTTSNRVGIGTTSPAYALDVDGDINMRTGHSFYYDAAGATNPNPVFWIDGENTDIDIIRVGTDQFSTDSDYGVTLKYRGSGSGTSNAFDIEMDNQAGTQITAMSILQNGNVGIGTTTPSRKLIVSGSGFDGGSADFISTNSGNGLLVTGVDGAGINDSAYLVLRDQNNTSFIGLTGTAAGAGGMRFSVNGERMRINSSGNVGIGQSSPSYRLDVSGPEDTASRVGISSGNTAYRYHMRFTRNGGMLANGIFSDTGATYFGNASDVNLKTGISDLSKQDALAAVSSLRPVEYRYLLDTEDVVRKGFIAQEMVEVIPEAVHRVGGGHPATSLIYDENGDLVATDVDENGDPIVQQEPDWVMTWEPITTTLVAAVQAQQELIQELTDRIEALEAN